MEAKQTKNNEQIPQKPQPERKKVKAKKQIRFYEKICCQILKQGQIPHHIGFIMDGNRRFAVKHGMEKSDGHTHGFNSLKKCLEWCVELDVQIVTVFAFAIENFKRNEKEVTVLMNLAKNKLREMADNGDFLELHQIKVNIIGDLDLLPKDVYQAMEEIMELTKNYKKMEFNVCFAYNSSYEIDRATTETVKQAKEKEEYQIKYEDFCKNLLIESEPDIMVRTSNEIRLSNFMTVQSTNSQLQFLRETWPEISIFSFLKIILDYQVTERNQKSVQKQLNQIQEEIK